MLLHLCKPTLNRQSQTYCSGKYLQIKCFSIACRHSQFRNIRKFNILNIPGGQTGATVGGRYVGGVGVLQFGNVPTEPGGHTSQFSRATPSLHNLTFGGS